MQNVVKFLFEFAPVILSAAAIFGVITYFRTAKNNKATAAMELVCYYVDNLIPSMSFITNCADKEIYNRICEKIDNIKPLFFLRDEMNTIFKYTTLPKEYDIIFDSITLERVEENYHKLQFGLKFFDDFYVNIIKKALDNGSDAQKEIARKKFIEYMKCLVRCTVNYLEYFAMGFQTIGDQRIVYSSIHQTYLKYAKFFYIHICNCNHSYRDYFFSNIQKLYNKWNNNQNKYEKRDTRNRESLYRKYRIN